MRFLLLVSLCWSGASWAIEVQGHRGARGIRPENTLAAFRYAIELGVDVLELDLVVTKDNHLVISHDPILNPEICLSPQGKKIAKDISVRSLTLKELQQYDCGSLKNPRFPKQVSSKEKIPSFQELIAIAPRAKFNIETKTEPAAPHLTPDANEFAKLVVTILEKNNLVDRTVVQSFDFRTIKAVKSLNPKVKTAQLIYGTYLNYVDVAKSSGADIISPDVASIDLAAVEALHKNKIKVIPWTANEPAEWDYLISIGVDGIISDYPSELIKHLKIKKKR